MSDHGYPHLKYLLQSYFHQDWRTDDASTAVVARRFCIEENAERVAATRDEIERLLGAADDRQLAALVISDLDCEIDPTAFGLTLREWLAAIVAGLS